MSWILKLLAKSVCYASEARHGDTELSILSFDVATIDVLRYRDCDLFHS